MQSSSESEVTKTDGTDEKMETEPVVNSAVNLPEVEMSEPEENVPIDLSGVRRTEPENIPSSLPSGYMSAFQQLQQPTVSGNPVYPNLVVSIADIIVFTERLFAVHKNKKIVLLSSFMS